MEEKKVNFPHYFVIRVLSKSDNNYIDIKGPFIHLSDVKHHLKLLGGKYKQLEIYDTLYPDQAIYYY